MCMSCMMCPLHAMQWHCGAPAANRRCSRSRSRGWVPLRIPRASMAPPGIGLLAASFAAAAAAARIAAAFGTVALVPAQTVPLRLHRRRGRPNRRACVERCRPSRLVTADPTGRTVPAVRLLLSATHLVLALQFHRLACLVEWGALLLWVEDLQLWLSQLRGLLGNHFLE